jgi:two-component system sensor histidine kinase HydH
VREVCRSEPTFGRRLLFASAFFSALLVADLFVVGNLAFVDLSHRVIDRAFQASLAALEPHGPSPALSWGNDAAAEDGLPTESCPPGVALTPSQIRACVTARPEETPGPRIFSAINSQWQRVVIDLQGKILRRSVGHAGMTVSAEPSAPPIMAGHGEVPERWEFVDGRQDVIAIHRQGDEGPGAIGEVGIPRALIEQELQQLRGDLEMKLWIGAGCALLILLAAFGYVLRLLHRTRLLEAQAQMDDRLAFVGGLAAGLAHEIRNPLNVLSMNLQMLEEEIAADRGAGTGEDARAYVATLQGEIRRLSNLVNNFLSYARPNQPRFETRDLNEVLREIARLVRPEFETRGLSLKEDFASYMPPVDLDEAQMRQAVMNILINATQVLKPDDMVWIHSRVGPEGEALVIIEDNGPGIKPEDRGRIFEIFYSTRGGGTGLGLPIAARIMEAHGGTISVESEPGKGARFILKLPRRHLADGAPTGSATALAAPSRP